MNKIVNEEFLQKFHELIYKNNDKIIITDIPRLLKNITLDVYNNQIISYEKGDAEDEIYSFLNDINKHLFEKNLEKKNYLNTENFQELLNDNDNMNSHDKKLSNLLKYLTQAIIIKPITFIRLQQPNLLFKDSKEKCWKIKIEFLENKNEYKIIHFRKEDVISKKLKKLFDFTWNFSIILNSNLEFNSCYYSLTISDQDKLNYKEETQIIENSFNKFEINDDNINTSIDSEIILSTEKKIYYFYLTLLYGLTYFAYSFSINCISWSSIRLQENTKTDIGNFGYIFTLKGLGYFFGGLVLLKLKEGWGKNIRFLK
jgi:hypothetical protein